MTMMAPRVWLADVGARHVDGLGRAVGWSGAALLAAAAREASCGAGTGPCQPVRLLDGRSRCPACGDWWTVSQVAGHAGVARATVSAGIDVEDRRHRPAAYRAASAWCDVAITTAEQWTQAEALWKAMGLGRRGPVAGEIPLPALWAPGWQASRDGQWWLYTDSVPFPWSLALPRAGAAEPRLRLDTLSFRPPPPPGRPAPGPTLDSRPRPPAAYRPPR
jgi:hypothetical protein